MMTISQLVQETTISYPTINRVLNDKKEYKTSRNTLRSLCEFFKVSHQFLEDGILMCQKCLEDVNFNLKSQEGSYRCPNCRAKLYPFIKVVTLLGNDKIDEFQAGEIKKMIGDYKLLYSSVKDLIENIDKKNLGILSFKELTDYKNKLNLKEDIYEKINELIEKHNDKIN